MSRAVVWFCWMSLGLSFAFLVTAVAVTGDKVKVTYYDDGSVAEIATLNGIGQLHGESRTYDRSGRLQVVSHHFRGTLVSFTTFWPSGQPRSQMVEDSNYHALEKPVSASD